MSGTLYQYYEEELQFLRQQGRDFAARYPAAANRLQLESTRSADPHVERLIESFAFLTARIQKKIQDDFPEVTDALLNILYPHYLAPIPSFATVQFAGEPANLQPAGTLVDRGTRLRTNKIGDVACQFRTCYPVTLWPVEIAEATAVTPPFPDGVTVPAGTAAVIRLRLQCQRELSFEQLKMESLRLHLAGDTSVASAVYALLFNHASHVEFVAGSSDGAGDRTRLAARDCLRQVGFAENEGLLPYTDQSFMGYRLLTELFSFPEKFLYFDLAGFQELGTMTVGRSLDVLIHLDCPLGNVEHTLPSLFRLGCTPIVNLFSRVAEPLQLSHTKSQYQVSPDYRRPHAFEVYSIDEVYAADAQVPKPYRAMYDYRGQSACASGQSAMWYASRRDSHRADDRGSDVYLHPVDPGLDASADSEETLVVRTTCTNRDLPIQLQLSGDRLRFELESALPVKEIHCLRTPTTPLRPPRRRNAQWRLVSHLSLNHLSLTTGRNGNHALAEMLRLYDFSDPDNTHQLRAVNRQWIAGVGQVSSRRRTARLSDGGETSICRGLEVTVDLDEEKFAGCGFLFASVLERFLGLYASINSFVQLVATSDGGDNLICRWPPRAGEMELL